MSKALFIIALTATFAVLESSAVDYCRIQSCNPREHTICKYGFMRVDRNRCRGLKSSRLTRSEMSEILNAHNEYRRLVASGRERRGNPGPQPAASNLGPLRWDPELATIAQSWADQCDWHHDECRNVERFQVNQNIAYESLSDRYTANWTSFVKGWYDEVAEFNKNYVISLPRYRLGGPVVSHYTQMVWAKTTRVGCGGVRYQDDKWYNTYLVCNYGPRGNMAGQEIYRTR